MTIQGLVGLSINSLSFFTDLITCTFLKSIIVSYTSYNGFVFCIITKTIQGNTSLVLLYCIRNKSKVRVDYFIS